MTEYYMTNPETGKVQEVKDPNKWVRIIEKQYGSRSQEAKRAREEAYKQSYMYEKRVQAKQEAEDKRVVEFAQELKRPSPEAQAQIQQYQQEIQQEGLNKYNEKRMQELLQAQQQKLEDARNKTIEQQYKERNVYTPIVLSSKYQQIEENKQQIEKPILNIAERPQPTFVPEDTKIKTYDGNIYMTPYKSEVQKAEQPTFINLMTEKVNDNKYNEDKSFGSNLLQQTKVLGMGGAVVGVRAVQTGWGTIKTTVTEPLQLFNPVNYVKTAEQLAVESKTQPLLFAGDVVGIYGGGKVISTGINKASPFILKKQTPIKATEYKTLETVRETPKGKIKSTELVISTIEGKPKTVWFNRNPLKPVKTMSTEGLIKTTQKIEPFKTTVSKGEVKGVLVNEPKRIGIKIKDYKEINPPSENVSPIVFNTGRISSGVKVEGFTGEIKKVSEINIKEKYNKPNIKLINKKVYTKNKGVEGTLLSERQTTGTFVKRKYELKQTLKKETATPTNNLNKQFFEITDKGEVKYLGKLTESGKLAKVGEKPISPEINKLSENLAREQTTVLEKPKTITPQKTKGNYKPIIEVKQQPILPKVGSVVVPILGSTYINNYSTTQTIKPMQTIEPIQDIQQLQSPIQTIKPMQTIEPIQDIQQLQSPIQTIKPMQTIEPIQDIQQLQKIDLTTTMRIPETKKTNILGFLPRISNEQKEKVKGYNVYMKEYKKVVKANEKPLPYEEAVRLGQDIADNSLSASYKISNAKVNVNKATRSKYATNNFNPNNFIKSAKQTGWFIEKKNKRLDTYGERQGITASKLLAQRRNALMQNKTIKWRF